MEKSVDRSDDEGGTMVTYLLNMMEVLKSEVY